jgi:protein-S-isoprenylcysteine O-methyltransferase Ste14
MQQSTHDGADRPSRVPWPPLLLAGAIAGGWMLQRIHPLPWPGLDDTPARVIGVGLGLAGMALMAWAAVTFRRHRTTIMPHKGADALVTDGPFRRYRNPIYIADVLLILGAAELSKSLWMVLLVPVFVAAVTWLAILPEERHLEARFGDAYRAYKARSKRWI